MKKLALFFDETRASELAGLLGNFCEKQNYYFRYGTDHRALFKELIRKQDINTVLNRIGLPEMTSNAPKEVVDVIKGLLKPRRVSEAQILRMLRGYIPLSAYKEKYSMTNPKVFESQYAAFRKGVIERVNKLQKANGITMKATRTKKKEKARG